MMTTLHDNRVPLELPLPVPPTGEYPFRPRSVSTPGGTATAGGGGTVHFVRKATGAYRLSNPGRIERSPGGAIQLRYDSIPLPEQRTTYGPEIVSTILSPRSSPVLPRRVSPRADEEDSCDENEDLMVPARTSLFGAMDRGEDGRASTTAARSAGYFGAGIGAVAACIIVAVSAKSPYSYIPSRIAIAGLTGSTLGLCACIGSWLAYERVGGGALSTLHHRSYIHSLRSHAHGVAALVIAEGTGLEAVAVSAVQRSTRARRKLKAGLTRRRLFGDQVGPTRLKKAIALADRLQAKLSGVLADTAANRLVVERAVTQELRDMDWSDSEKAISKPLIVSLYFMRRLPHLMARAIECDPVNVSIQRAFRDVEYVDVEPRWAATAREVLPGWMARWLIAAKTEQHPLQGGEDQ